MLSTPLVCGPCTLSSLNRAGVRSRLHGLGLSCFGGAGARVETGAETGAGAWVGAETRAGAGAGAETDLAGVWVVEPLDQGYDGAFAHAAWAHERHLLPGLDLNAELVQHGDVRPSGVCERHVPELDMALERRHRASGVGITGLHRRYSIDDLVHAEGALLRLQNPCESGPHGAQLVACGEQHRDGCKDIPGTVDAQRDQVPAVDKAHNVGAHEQEACAAEGEAKDEAVSDAVLLRQGDLLVVPCALPLDPIEGVDRPDGGEHLLRDRMGGGVHLDAEEDVGCGCGCRWVGGYGCKRAWVWVWVWVVGVGVWV